MEMGVRDIHRLDHPPGKSEGKKKDQNITVTGSQRTNERSWAEESHPLVSLHSSPNHPEQSGSLANKRYCCIVRSVLTFMGRISWEARYKWGYEGAFVTCGGGGRHAKCSETIHAVIGNS